MGLVNALRFSTKDGALITDEEYWLNGRRRTFFRDNLQVLIPEEVANADGIEIIYGGTGDPCFHHEVVDKSKKTLKNFVASKKYLNKKDSPIYESSKEIMKIAHDVTEKKINQKLMLLYGFTKDDLVKNNFEKDGNKYSIKQDCVRKKALNFMTWADKNSAMKNLFESRALIMGCDAEEGVQLFYMNVENQVLSFNSGNYDCIGSGIYGSGHVYANYMRKKHLQKRLDGYPRVEGMFTLIESALVSSQTFKAIGGYFNILYLDSTQNTQNKRIKHIIEDRAKLAAEVVASYKIGLLSLKDSMELIDNLIFQDANVLEMDELLFKLAKNPSELELFLRGYKLDNFEKIDSFEKADSFEKDSSAKKINLLESTSPIKEESKNKKKGK